MRKFKLSSLFLNIAIESELMIQLGSLFQILIIRLEKKFRLIAVLDLAGLFKYLLCLRKLYVLVILFLVKKSLKFRSMRLWWILYTRIRSDFNCRVSRVYKFNILSLSWYELNFKFSFWHSLRVNFVCIDSSLFMSDIKCGLHIVELYSVIGLI